ncbi:homocysteine S-methyltransferase family protein [Bordetella bronchialis]|nr:homocysteine S-methyltransferase family protein [Bordetella bronchialis]
MPRLPFADACRAGTPVLADGGIETRLIYEFGADLPEFASFLPLFRQDRDALERIYRSYLRVAASSGLPMQIGTPTWRAHPDCLARLGYGQPGDLARVNSEAFRLLAGLRAGMGLEDRVYIAGVIGPRRDGYDPAGAPGTEEARAYHAPQVRVLAACGVDLLYAPTFACLPELLGVARAMAETGLPYVLAPVLGADGLLPDGTPLAKAIDAVDAQVSPRPLHIMIGCVHPTRVGAMAAAAGAAGLPARVAGLKANASALPPEDLDKLDHLDEGDARVFAAQMAALRRDHGLRVLGGCCGTSHLHIAALAEILKNQDA